MVLRDRARASGLVDIWQIQQPTSRDYTLFSSHNSLSRIDLFLISQSLVSAVLSCDIGNRILSDHSLIYLHVISFGKP